MRRHVFILSQRDTDHWCRTLHIDVLLLVRVQRQRRFRRRIGVLFAGLLAVTALLMWVFAHDLPW